MEYWNSTIQWTPLHIYSSQFSQSWRNSWAKVTWRYSLMLDLVSLHWVFRALSQGPRSSSHFLHHHLSSLWTLPLCPITWHCLFSSLNSGHSPALLQSSFNMRMMWTWICSNTRDPILGTFWLILNLGEKSLAHTQNSLQYFVVMEKACTGTGICSLCQCFFCLVPCEGKSHWV